MSTISDTTPFDLQEFLSPKQAGREVTASLSGGSMSSEVKSEGNKSIFEQKTLGKQDFLNLLVTQLRYQDPLQPTENTEFVAQLAQFSALENSQNVSQSMDNLKEKIEGLVDRQYKSSEVMSNASATSLIGRNLKLQTTQLAYNPAQGREMQIPAHAETGGAVLTITSRDGSLIRALEMKTRGDSMVVWDGNDQQGNPVPAGNYVMRVASPDGTREMGYAFREERVKAIRYTADGLRLQGANQDYKMDEVLEVREAEGA